MVVHVFSSCTPEVVQEDFSEFKASLVHIARTAKTIQRPCLKKMGGEVREDVIFKFLQRSYCPGVKYDFLARRPGRLNLR